MAQKLPLPIPSASAIRKLGMDICSARRRRRIPTKLMAERMGCTQVTLRKIEKGEPQTSIGNYARALFVLGFSERLRDLADALTDVTSLAIEEENLPKRIRLSKKKPSDLL